MQQFAWIRWIDSIFLDAKTPRDIVDSLINFLGLGRATTDENQIMHLCDANFLTNEAGSQAIVIKLSDTRQIALIPKNQSCVREIHCFVHLVSLGIELANRRQKLIAESLRDPLTGLLNRRGWDSYFKGQHTVSGIIAFLDIDDFKGLNLEIGYQSADDRLARFGAMLMDSIRTTDCVCRWGGDEFVIFFNDASEDGVRSRLRDASRQTEIIIGRSFSFGLFDFLPDGLDSGELSHAVNCAEQLMRKVTHKAG